MDAAVSRIEDVSGAGSQARRREELAALFGRATEEEQRFLVGLFLGELRQGALEGVMSAAVAKAAGVPRGRRPPRDDARRGPRARSRPSRCATAVQGLAALHADAAPSGAADARADGRATSRTPSSASGRRRSNGSSTARASRCTARATRCAPSRGTSPTSRTACRRSSRRCSGLERRRGRPRRRGDRARPRGAPAPVPGDDEPLREQGERRGAAQDGPALAVLLRRPPPRRRGSSRPARARAPGALDRSGSPPSSRVPRIETADPAEAQRFLEDALARGHEGVMVKSLDAPLRGRATRGWAG